VREEQPGQTVEELKQLEEKFSLSILQEGDAAG
jgi:hypothetical protein